MYYLQSRYYNGSWGRFINADALIGQPGDILSFNMFAYCGNNPVIMEDPNGYRFDITGGRDNVDHISMAIQSQYPAIAKNVQKKKIISSINKSNEQIKSAVKGEVGGGADKIVAKVANKISLPKVEKLVNKIGPLGNVFKFEGIYSDMKTCKLNSVNTFRWDNLAVFGAMTMFDIGVGGLTSMVVAGVTVGMAFTPALFVGVAIGFTGAVIGATLKDMMGFQELVK